jgi:hypothetical protein
MRPLTVIAVACVVAGCGSGHKAPSTPHAVPAPAGAPGTHHARRPPHSVYDDEVGESIIGTPYSRLVRMFGSPATRRSAPGGFCVFYDLVGQAPRGWEFCIRGGRVESAISIDRSRFGR